jgi:hypothetical protein
MIFAALAALLLLLFPALAAADPPEGESQEEAAEEHAPVDSRLEDMVDGLLDVDETDTTSTQSEPQARTDYPFGRTHTLSQRR